LKTFSMATINHSCSRAEKPNRNEDWLDVIIKIILCLLIATFSLPVLSAEVCLERPFNLISPVIPDFAAAEDNFPIGTQFNSVAVQATQSVIIDCSNDLSEKLHSVRLYPQLSASGVTWSFMGRDFPVYKTTVPSIGIAIGFKDTNAVNWIPLSAPNATVFPAEGTPTIPVTTFGGEMKVWYISLGELVTGSYTIPDTLIGKFTGHRENGSTLNWADATLSGTTINVVAMGCDLKSDSIGVELGQLTLSEFYGVGSLTSNKNFSITLDCDSEVKVDMDLSSPNIINSESGIIGLTSDGQEAKGVGVQVLNQNNTPIRLGDDVTVLSKTIIGLNSIGFSARYYQVDDVVSPGTANAVANFTIKYK
jgi:type 1 fimbria pilin